MAYAGTILATLVVDSTRRNLEFYAQDGAGGAVDLSGANATLQKLQGTSDDLPSNPIDVACTSIFNPTGGGIRWTQIGTLVSAATLGALPSATYVFRVKWTDSAGKWDYSEKFAIQWQPKPV